MIFMIGKANIVGMFLLSKVIYRLSTIPIKIVMTFFPEVFKKKYTHTHTHTHTQNLYLSTESLKRHGHFEQKRTK
jgi:hypothetical protein